MTDLEKQVLRLIPVGSSQPRQGRYIAMVLGIELRTVKHIINRLILKYGVAIVAKRTTMNRGYYIPANDTERLEGIRELKAQHDNEGRRLDALIKADLTSYRDYLEGE